MSLNIDDYAELDNGGEVVNKEPVKPEDEFFHSVYISGQTRVNHINITEEAKKIQIRGIEYNLQEVNMVIIHVKSILSKIRQGQRGETTECFSYKTGEPPWNGTSKLPDGTPRQCPMNATERAVVDFCKDCRAQIIVAGIYCQPDGTPILSEQNAPIFIFIRGKGMKYSNVSDYLGNMYTMDLSPIFTPVTDRSKRFEKENVNNKRFVTNLSMSTAPSAFGIKDVFTLKTSKQLADNVVIDILKMSKKTKPKFEEKFDWSKGVFISSTSQAPGVLDMGGQSEVQQPPVQPSQQPSPPSQPFSFDDVEY